MKKGTYGKCEKCGKREATQTWSQDEMSFIHGMSQQWCEYCVIKTQLAYAREQAKRIPNLEKELKIELLKLEQGDNDQLQRN